MRLLALLLSLFLLAGPVSAQVLEGNVKPSTAGGGSGAVAGPGGNPGELQWNNSGSLAGTTGMKMDATSVVARKDKTTALSGDTTLGQHNTVAVTVGSGAGVTLTLPAASSTPVSHYDIIIVDAGTANLTLSPNGSDKINGVNSAKARTGQFSGFVVDLIDASNGWLVRETMIYLTKTAMIDVALCNNATAFPALDLPTANAPTPTCLTGSNTQQGALDFADSAIQTAQFSIILPPGWVLGIDLDIYWLVTAGGGVGAAKWMVSTGCGSTAESYDVAFNTAQTLTATNLQANNILTKSTQTGITLTGCAAGEEMHIKVGHDNTDTSTATLRLRKLVLTMRVIPQL